MSHDLQAEAVLAAEYVLADLSHDPGQRFDIYGAIVRRGIWLSFDRYRNVLGHYQRLGDAAGISINVQRPQGLQRFTAAHELGHHELGHECVVDDLANVTGQARDPRELQAQVFAANLLMSELSIELGLEEWGFDPVRPALDPVDCYLLSAHFGVSFSALITQLAVLGKIGWAQKRVLAKMSPLALKRQLAAPHSLPDEGTAVIRVSLRQNRSMLQLAMGDYVIVELPEADSTRAQWQLSERARSSITVVSEVCGLPEGEPSLFQSAGTHSFLLTPVAQGPGEVAVHLGDRETGADASPSFSLKVHVEAPLLSSENQGICASQQTQLLNPV